MPAKIDFGIPVGNERADRPLPVVQVPDRKGENDPSEILSLLAIQFEPADGDPMTWMEPIAVAIAGELLLQPAIPLLISKLQADRDDWTNEQCDEALAKIGGDETAQAIARGWESSWHFRLYAASALVPVGFAAMQFTPPSPSPGETFFR